MWKNVIEMVTLEASFLPLTKVGVMVFHEVKCVFLFRLLQNINFNLTSIVTFLLAISISSTNLRSNAELLITPAVSSVWETTVYGWTSVPFHIKSSPIQSLGPKVPTLSCTTNILVKYCETNFSEIPSLFWF